VNGGDQEPLDESSASAWQFVERLETLSDQFNGTCRLVWAAAWVSGFRTISDQT
jgi:hypothetical protein